MKSVYEFLQFFGSQSTDLLWFPILVWTFMGLVAFLILKSVKNLNPLYHYHLRVAVIAAIPFGLLTTYSSQFLGSVFSASNSFKGAIFVVQSPLELTVTAQNLASDFSPNWFDLRFLIGFFTASLFIISAVMLIRLMWSYITLKKLHKSLVCSPLDKELSGSKTVHLAYQDHPLVPFTFGWKNPIIVLPNSIKNDAEKVRMAIQHELVHIHRGDYLLQLLLSVIESIFWFHPLIHFGMKEIETYREISCDQEVLNTTEISPKNYASMLYELVPLQRGMGSFSVSMAVQQSTLKRRIETMKYHKLYKISLKRSVLFLVLMITAVTIPIACSDMQGPQGLSPEELENTTIEINNISISVNDVQVLKRSGGSVTTASGISSMFFNTGEYGIFKISLLKFQGGKLAGEIAGNTIRFKVNELSVIIKSETRILSNIDETNIWVEHLPTKSAGFSQGVARNDMALREYYEMNEKNRFSEIIETNQNHFLVVEKMPELIGGLVSVQSKVQYPEMAKRAGIEGRVTLQFIVNEQGEVENPKVIRGIGGGCDEAALEAVKLAKFSPGLQQGKPVKVQYSLPIIFRLSSTDG